MRERTARTVDYSFDRQAIDVQDDDVAVGRFDFKMSAPGSGPDEHPPKTNVDISYLFDLKVWFDTPPQTVFARVFRLK
jgi:hypothetical protein